MEISTGDGITKLIERPFGEHHRCHRNDLMELPS